MKKKQRAQKNYVQKVEIYNPTFLLEQKIGVPALPYLQDIQHAAVQILLHQFLNLNKKET